MIVGRYGRNPALAGSGSSAIVFEKSYCEFRNQGIVHLDFMVLF
jgi:hypothetical protein